MSRKFVPNRPIIPSLTPRSFLMLPSIAEVAKPICFQAQKIQNCVQIFLKILGCSLSKFYRTFDAPLGSGVCLSWRSHVCMTSRMGKWGFSKQVGEAGRQARWGV